MSHQSQSSRKIHYALEEEPGDGIRTEKWVGAFERVLGDHQGEALRNNNPGNGVIGRNGRAKQEDLDCGELGAVVGSNMQRSRSAAAPPPNPTTSSTSSSSSSTSANTSPMTNPIALPSGPLDSFNHNHSLFRTNTDPGILDQRRQTQQHQSNHPHPHPQLPPQAHLNHSPSRNQQPSSKLLSVSSGIESSNSYLSSLSNQPSVRRSSGDEPLPLPLSTTLQKSDGMGLGFGILPSSSPTKNNLGTKSLVSISIPLSESTNQDKDISSTSKKINFENIYLNHAPGLRLVKIRNLLDDKRVLVRLESDFGRGVSFMRRKRTAPRHTLDSITWPANSTAWASAGGLTPARLRDLRHMGANLEPSDSFILEPGSSTDLFVVFKPSVYASQSTKDNSKFAQIRSPQVIQESDQDRKSLTTTSDSESRASPSSGFESIPHFSGRSNASSSSTDLSTSSQSQGGQESISSSQAPVINNYSIGSEITTSTEPADSAHAAFDVQGSVTLRAWALTSSGIESSTPTSASRSQSQPRSDDGNESGASNLSSGTSSRPPSFYSSNVSSGSATTSSGPQTEQEGERDQGLEIEDGEEMQTFRLPLFARSCRAQLALSMDLVDDEVLSESSSKKGNEKVGVREKETDLNQRKQLTVQTQAQRHGLLTCDLGDILVGQQEERNLVIHNLAEIPTFWQAKFEDADNMLQTSPVSVVGALSNQSISAINTGVGGEETDQDFDVNKEHKLCTRILPPRSSNHLRIVLQPQEPCRDYEQVITFTNLHETSNSVKVLVRANILGSAKDDVLAVLSGDDLDFGDCCGGHWTRQLLILKNPGDSLLDVAFSIQKGVEATFQLAELAPQTEIEEAQVAPPFLPHESNSAASSTEMVVGSSSSGAPLSSKDGLSASTGSYNPPPSPGGSVSSNLELHHSTAGMELTRTPTHHPQLGTGPDPPHFKLPSNRSSHSGESPASGGGAPVTISPHCESSLAPRMKRNDDDDVDASSNASQAGSRAGSPPPLGPSAPPHSPTSAFSWGAAGETPKDALGAVRSEMRWRGPGSDGSTQASSLGGRGLSETVSDKFSAGSSLLRSKPSSGLLSSKGPVSALRGFEGNDHFDDAASSRSDVTAISQDSRLGPIMAGASSSQGGSSNAARSHHSSSRTGVLSGLRNVEQAHNNQLEELVLRPGGEYRVIVSYKPPRGSLDEDYTAGKLVETKFRISLDYARFRSGGTRSRGGRARKTILCHTRTCTSFISVSPKLVDFGEANVGARKSANIAVKNHSELTARVDLRFVSKVLSMYRDEVAIPPLQTVELKVDFFPRRVNEAYRKQITVANLLNRHNDQIFEVRSRNVDQQRVSFHSLFYRILTPTGSNFIDFGDVNIGSTRIRSFGIENTSSAKLGLDLSAAHPEDLTLYVKAPAAKSTPVMGPQSTSTNVGTRTPNRYAEVEASDVLSAISSTDTDVQVGGLKPKGIKGGNLKGADLKERFLETISVDSPASIRHENAVWRVAQRQSHFAKKKNGGDANGNSKTGGTTTKPKAPLNLLSALRKGGKGRITIIYGKSVTFKDRKLLQDFEFLDLATGPPVDQKRIPAKSKKYQALETLETGKKPQKAGATKSTAKSALSPAPSDAGDAPPPPKTTSRKRATSKRPVSPTDMETPRKNGISNTPGNTLPHLKTVAGVDASSGAGEDGVGNRSPAITGKRKASLVLSDPTDVSKLSLEELLAAVEAQTSNLNTFFLGNPAAEERHVRTEINLLKELRGAISSGRLVRADSLSIKPGVEQQVIAVYSPNGSTRPHVQGNARKQDSRIFLRLSDFDTSLVQSSPEFAPMAKMDRDELPVRDLMVRSTTCRSLLELGQPHINFGQMDKGDTKTRKILIQNRSEWALRYCIRKSGSISSGDIKLSSGRYGVVPGYGKREVEFIFSPSLSGQFQERLVVENVGDRENDQTVVLKANVRKVPNFIVDPISLDFGSCKPGKLSSAESFVVTNTTAKTRTFVVAVDPHDLRLQRAIVDLVLTTANSGDVRGTLTKAEEEEVEHISQKLKIASRKGHHDKVKKYEGRLEELGVKQASPENLDQQSTAESNEADLGGDFQSIPVNESEATEENPSAKLKRVSSLVTVGLAPNQSKRLLLRIRANAVDTVLGAAHSAAENHVRATTEEVNIPMRVHEVKNQDETRTVTVKALVELEEENRMDREELPIDADAIIFTSLSASS